MTILIAQHSSGSEKRSDTAHKHGEILTIAGVELRIGKT